MKASAIRGKKVPQKITAASPTRRRLLTRKIDSRESSESKRRSGRRSARRLTISTVEPTAAHATSASRGPPTVEAPNA